VGKTRTGYRSAVTGKFLKPGEAKKHPRTTVRERIPVKPKKGQ